MKKGTYDVYFTVENCLSKSIHASRNSATCISNITSCYRTRSETMVQPYVTVFDKKSTKMIPVQNEYTTSIIESIFSRRKGHISPFKTFMEKHMKASNGWLSQEHKKVCKELNIVEPRLERKKTISEKTMIVVQYLLLKTNLIERVISFLPTLPPSS